VDWLVEADDSEKNNVSIFRAEVIQTSLPATIYNPSIPSMVTSALKMKTVRFSKTLASTSQSTRCPNPEEHHQYRHRRENLTHQTLCI
jgi:hypothetical protein